MLSRRFWWVCGYCSSQTTPAQAILENLKCLSLWIPQCREGNPRNGVRRREDGLEIEKVSVMEIGREQARDRLMVTVIDKAQAESHVVRGATMEGEKRR